MSMGFVQGWKRAAALKLARCLHFLGEALCDVAADDRESIDPVPWMLAAAAVAIALGTWWLS